MINVLALEQRVAQLTQAAEQLLANYNATNGAKQEVMRLLEDAKAAAANVTSEANAVEAVIEPAPAPAEAPAV